jgi:hypothetical protein
MAPSIPTSRRSRHVDHPRPPAPASWPASVERLKRRPAQTLPASTHRRAGARHRPARSGDKNPRAGEPARGNALWGLGGRIKRAERSNTPSGFLFDRSTQKMHGPKAASWKRVQIVLFNLERRDSGDRTPKEAITPRLVRRRFALGPFAPTLRRLTRAPSMRRKSVSARRSG